MEKYTQKQLRELVRLGCAEDYTHKPSEYIYTLRRLDKVAIPRAFTASTAASSRTPKPARGTPLSGVAQTCLSCFKGGAGLISILLLIIWFPLAVLPDVVRKSK